MSNSEAHKNPSATHGPITSPGKSPDGIDHAIEEEHAHDHHGGTMQYMAVFVALCFLTTMSFLTYSSYWPWRDEPQVGWAFMMAVSCTKALLVVLFFMHVLWEANWKYVLTIPAAMMAIF
ncbi:MAG: cytochrome C oxidase subunit IV family protein [Pirellulales bacterium]|nr:cytochrome C oxidase subunit IV family protein [Pirellulales bacterium]